MLVLFLRVLFILILIYLWIDIILTFTNKEKQKKFIGNVKLFYNDIRYKNGKLGFWITFSLFCGLLIFIYFMWIFMHWLW